MDLPMDLPRIFQVAFPVTASTHRAHGAAEVGDERSDVLRGRRGATGHDLRTTGDTPRSAIWWINGGL